MSTYDLVVIGGGSAGLVAAVGAAKLGAKVCLIEKDRLGGDCLWYGCVPSKALIRSARLAWDIKNSKRFGFEINVPQIDLSKVMAYVEDVQQIVGLHDHPKRFEALGIHVLFGNPCFISRHQVQVNQEWIHGKKILISTGSKAKIPNIPGLEESGFLDNVSIFGLKKLPEHLVIIGSGPVGIEMAQAFHRLGSKVTVIVRNNRILSKEDEEIAYLAQSLLEKEGIVFLTKAQVKEISRIGGQKRILLWTKEELVEISCDQILVAVGRQPNIDGLNLEAAGVAYSSERIVVDQYLRTSAPNIFAAGDVAGNYQFTHVAEYEAKLVLRNALFPFSSKRKYQGVPWVTFIDPELAHVGKTEEELQVAGERFDVFRVPFKDVDRAQTEGYPDGMVKILVDQNAKILGAHVLGIHAGEIIHECVLAMNANIPITKISSTIHAYPTISQAVRKVCDQYYSKKLFSPKVQKLTKWMVRFFS